MIHHGGGEKKGGLTLSLNDQVAYTPAPLKIPFIARIKKNCDKIGNTNMTVLYKNELDVPNGFTFFTVNPIGCSNALRLISVLFCGSFSIFWMP